MNGFKNPFILLKNLKLKEDLKMNYLVYEVNTNRNIFLTDDFDHAFNLCFQFNDEAKNKENYDIKKVNYER